MEGLQNLYLICQMHPYGDDLHTTIIGKFYLDKEHFEVLEDHVGWLEGLQKETPAEVAQTIWKMANSMYYKVVSLEDVRQGKYPELIPETPVPPSAGPESRFEYHRLGMANPQLLEFHEGKAYLDGHPLSSEDLQQMLDNVQAGHATLGYKSEEDVQKAEELFLTLAKVEPQLEAALQGLRAAVKAGHVHPDVLKNLTKEIFTDSMVRGTGNKKAYLDFLGRPKQGIHIRMDGNDFGPINKIHGFETGNMAIGAMGGAIREAMNEAVGRSNGKVFRIGGDEFHAFVPSHEHAAQFARAVRNKLEAIPAVGGTHNLSLSIGFGHTPDHAELALINAKGQKKATGAKPGQAKTHAASQVPGYEGHIPTGSDQLPLRPLPTENPMPHVGASAPAAPLVDVSLPKEAGLKAS
jgi:GGDEF domain-containing protein